LAAAHIWLLAGTVHGGKTVRLHTSLCPSQREPEMSCTCMCTECTPCWLSVRCWGVWYLFSVRDCTNDKLQQARASYCWVANVWNILKSS